MADKFYTPKEATTPTANTDPSLVQRQQALATEDAQRRIRRDLESLKSSIVSTDDAYAPVRHTVFTAPHSAGNPSCFVASGAGVNISGLSASDPLGLTWSNGWGTPANYRSLIEADPSTAWVGLTLYATPSCYIENDGNGVLTYGHSVYPPCYGKSFSGVDCGAFLALFEGADGATTFTDSYGTVWTLANGAKLKNTTKKYNATTSLYCDGTDDYAEAPAPDFSGKWTLEGWICPTDSTRASAQVVLYSNLAFYGISLQITTAGKLALYVSSNGSSWNIANGLTGSTVLTDNAWAHIAVVFNGATYKVYLNGTCETGCTATSSTSCTQPRMIRLGVSADGTSNDFYGYFEGIRFSPNARYNTNFTAPGAAFATEEQHWFDTIGKVMKKGTPASWAKTYRLFVCEAETDSSAVTSVTSYQINGEYDSGWYAVAVANNYSLAHKIGVSMDKNTIIMSYSKGGAGYESIPFLSRYMDAGGNNYGWWDRDTTVMQRTRLNFRFGNQGYLVTYMGANQTAGYARTIIKRGF